jgi:membrane dipeptidase
MNFMDRIIDLHCDTVLALQAGKKLSHTKSDECVTIPALKQGGVGLQIFACYISPTIPEERAFIEVLDLIMTVKSFCLQHPGQVEFVNNLRGVTDALQSSVTGIMLAVENGQAIQKNPDRITELYNLGVRYMTLTHSRHLSWAASSGEAWDKAYGLSALGKKIVNQMNTLGMIVDVSHVHERTFWDVLENTNKPIIASHSNCASICPTPRNLSDEQIKAIAENGGMIGINFFPGFLDKKYMEYQNEHCEDIYIELQNVEKKYAKDHKARYDAFLHFYKDFQKRMSPVQVNFKRIVDHMEYIINLVGDDYVGFGTDFDGVPALPNGISGSIDMPVIVNELKKRGFPDSSIAKICYQNFLRVLRENENNAI